MHRDFRVFARSLFIASYFSLSTSYTFSCSLISFLPCTNNSTFRSIPDNQEIYVSNQSETSLLIDILERIPSPDSESAQIHFEALATDNEVDIEDDEDAERVFFVKRIQAGKIPYDPFVFVFS